MCRRVDALNMALRWFYVLRNRCLRTRTALLVHLHFDVNEKDCLAQLWMRSLFKQQALSRRAHSQADIQHISTVE